MRRRYLDSMSSTPQLKSALLVLLGLSSCVTPMDDGLKGGPSSTGTGGTTASAANGGHAMSPGSVAGAAGTVGSAGTGGTSGSSSNGGSAGSVPAGVADAGGPVNGTCVGGAVPANVHQILQSRCLICHGDPPLAGVPASLASYAGLSRPSKSDPTKTVAEVSLVRVALSGGASRMPPVPGDPLTPSELQTLTAWVQGGMPLEGCAPPGAGGGSSDGGGSDSRADAIPPMDAGPDPFAAAPKCSSGSMWTGGTKESPLMQPGEACIACHSKPGSEAPKLAFGGTVYPTGHEPSQCNGSATQGAQVVLVDAAGKSYTATTNTAGNFFLKANTTLTPPIKAKVVFMGKERLMIGAVPNGDCNSCHTQAGTTTVMGSLKAPGRIVLP
jgi:hypothetical protein